MTSYPNNIIAFFLSYNMMMMVDDNFHFGNRYLTNYRSINKLFGSFLLLIKFPETIIFSFCRSDMNHRLIYKMMTSPNLTFTFYIWKPETWQEKWQEDLYKVTEGVKQKLEPRVLYFQVNILWKCLKHFRIEFNIIYIYIWLQLNHLRVFHKLSILVLSLR